MNTNCLEDIRCPNCGHESDFNIAVTTMALVYDDGVEDINTTDHIEWDETSRIECRKCDHAGWIADFTINED